MDKFEQRQIRALFIVTVLSGSTGLLAGCHGSGDSSGAQTTGSIKAAGTCVDPIVLKSSGTLDSESTNQASDTISGEDPTCVGYKTHGADQIYKLTLPAANTTRLRVTITPSQTPGPDAFDPVIYETENCTAQPTCLTGEDSHGGGSAEAVEYVNSTGKDKDVYVIVDGYDFQAAGGNFKLVTELLP
jgi:hypothetical protein